jgi:hypothetical protein
VAAGPATENRWLTRRTSSAWAAGLANTAPRWSGVVLPPEVERRTAGDREDDGPADGLQLADEQRAGTHQRGAGVARNREAGRLADRVGAQEPGHEHVGAGFVQLPGPDCLGPDCEGAAAVRVQEGREHRWRVEPRQAAPVDGPVGGRQGHGVQVADDGVILDGRVTVGHDAFPGPWRSR